MKEKIIQLLKKNQKVYHTTVKLFRIGQKYKRENSFLRKTIALLEKKRSVRCKNLSVSEWCDANGVRRQTLSDETKGKVYIPKVFENDQEDRVVELKMQEIYYALIENAGVVGSNNFLIKDGYCLNDKYLLESDASNFENDVVYDWEKEECVVELDRTPLSVEEGISFLGEATSNYHHWVFDTLGKIAYAAKLPHLDGIPILVDMTVKRHPTCMEILRLCGGGHPVIFVERNKYCVVKRLHYIAPCSWLHIYGGGGNADFINRSDNPNNLRGSMKTMEVIRFYRKTVLDCAANIRSVNRSKKIFITRPTSTSKRLRNETALAEIAAEYGFEPYDPSRYSILQQAADFMAADFIIAAEGSALVNLVWCHEGARVCIIDLADYKRYVFPTLAYLVGMHCDHLDADLVDCSGSRLAVCEEAYFRRYLEMNT